MSQKIYAILQARMGSTRLPGKVLKKINNEPMLYYCIERIKKSKYIDELIVATSTNIENDSIVNYCIKNDVKYYCGDENDVLKRYYECCKTNNVRNDDIIIRLTADCPLIDPNVIDKIIDFYLHHKYDYIKNTWFDNSYPSGFDVEVFDFETLEKHNDTETNIKNREHVLSSLDSKIFKKHSFSDIDTQINRNNLSFDYNMIHLSVDTQKDFDLAENIINNFKENINFTFTDVINYLNDNPKLVKMNIDDEMENKIKLHKFNT